MRVIGTAGHVDHGKSTLVQTLTGMHPDRLQEEREREMTIDLGFAWFNLPDGDPVGVVDVPGHRDFIENMLAGIGGIDAVLLVIAADEGIMPQTREHLAILDLLQINSGVVALTKADLAESEEWISLISDEVAQLLLGTALAGAPIVPVSARTGQGVPQLVVAIARCLHTRPPRPDRGRPRLPIDRVFTIAGFGTVVTGTLSDGALAVGDEVSIMPSGRVARIRGLQTHKQKIERAVPGSRVAVNLTGVQTSEVRRGEVLCSPNTLRATALLDVHFRQLPSVEAPLKHNSAVKLFMGASETMATARVISHEALPPGEAGWLQLVVDEAIVAVKGDRFILRRPSPGATIGGGVVIDPHPRRKHKRFDAATLQRLETLSRGSPAEILAQAAEAVGIAALSELAAKSGLESVAASEATTELIGTGELVALDLTDSPRPPPAALVATRATLNRLARQSAAWLADFHRAQPLRAGLPREELKSRLALATKAFNAFMIWAAATDLLVDSGATVRLPSHEIRLNARQTASVESLLADFRRDPHNTPSAKECAAAVGDDVLNVLIERGDLVPVSPEVLFLRATYQQMLEHTRQHIAQNGSITVATLRDQFGTSRKYALAFLEHLDSAGVTVRRGDERVLKTR